MTTYTYDADNELTGEQFGGTGQVPLAISMTYDADGEFLTESRYSNLAETQLVVVSDYTYDADGEITNLVDINGGGTTVANFTYTYDRDNRVTTEDNLGLMTTYTYDADSELTSETSILATIDYTYDANGNRTSGNAVIGSDNQLLSDNDWNYTYDADGNLIEKVGIATGPEHGITWTYTYNNQNQMTSAVEVQGSNMLVDATYEYDSFGNLIEESVTGSSVPTQVSEYAYDSSNVWAQLNGSNNLVMRHLFLNTVELAGGANLGQRHGRMVPGQPARLGKCDHRLDRRGHRPDHLRRLRQRLDPVQPFGQRQLSVRGRVVRCGHWARVRSCPLLRRDHRSVDDPGPDRVRGRGHQFVSICAKRSDERPRPRWSGWRQRQLGSRFSS